MIQNFLLFAGALLTALTAGLLFAYSCSVNPGLHRLPDAAYLSAMQEINRAILNPVFFLCFLGPVLVLPISAWSLYGKNPSTAFWYLLAAAVLYIAGVFGVTMLGNVPLNEALNSFDLGKAGAADMAAQRAAFEQPWNNLHLIRTIASILSFILVLMGGSAFQRHVS